MVLKEYSFAFSLPRESGSGRGRTGAEQLGQRKNDAPDYK
jgi:hypothetical protein